MFDAFRDEGWNTYYAPVRYAPAYHILHYIIGYFSIIIVIALSLLVLSSRGKEKWGPFLRLVFNLHTAIVTLFCITGQDWLSASVRTRCRYSPGLNKIIQADIGLHIGLKGINITFIADSNTSHNYHDIFYNEEFSLFAADDMESGLRSALERGLPYPILYVVEYFGVDAGGLRWSRVLRLTGHFVYIMLWSALTMWVLSQILLSFVISRAALLNMGSGIFMMVAVLFYHGIQPDTPLVIPFEDGVLRLTYGWCFWLTCASGILTILYSIGLLVLHRWLPEITSEIILCDVVHSELYERVKPIHEGLLQIHTPYHERKQKNLERFQSSYDNAAFASEEPTSDIARYNNRRCSMKKKSGNYINQSESDTSLEIELVRKRTFSSPAILSELPSDDIEKLPPDNAKETTTAAAASWELSPDYSSTSEDEEEITLPIQTTVVEVNECEKADLRNKGFNRERAKTLAIIDQNADLRNKGFNRERAKTLATIDQKAFLDFMGMPKNPKA